MVFVAAITAGLAQIGYAKIKHVTARQSRGVYRKAMAGK